MHEFSLAQGLHNQLIDLAQENSALKIQKAVVLVGDNAGIVVESFVFGFDVLAEQHDITSGMLLTIESGTGDALMLMRVELE